MMASIRTPPTTQGTTIFVTKLGSELEGGEVPVEVSVAGIADILVDPLDMFVSPEGTNTETNLQS